MFEEHSNAYIKQNLSFSRLWLSSL